MMSTDKKNILVYSDWYLPGYRAGGPIRSLANMVSTLKHHFYIVTRNTDHHSTEAYKGISVNKWTQLSSNVFVYYTEEEALTTEVMREIYNYKDFDRIYFNSLFSPKFTLLPLREARKLNLQQKCVLAPRGMLKAGALSVKSNKKKIFLIAAKLMRWFEGIVWHATSAEEMQEIKKAFPRALQIKIAPNLSSAPMEKKSDLNKKKGELKLVCIARISPEKGIMEALRYLQHAGLEGTVVCDFFGVQQNQNYFEQCLQYSKSIPGIEINFMGEILPSEIPGVLQKYHFFYLPTLGENFGHAISEALINGKPVIISDRTPWRALQEKQAGWDLQLEPSAFAAVLQECLAMGNGEYSQLCNGAYKFGSSVALDNLSIEATYRLFE